MGIAPEIYRKQIRDYSTSLSVHDFESGLLKPGKLEDFCTFLSVNPEALYDDYYSFVFSDYGKTLIKFRANKEYNQKQMGFYCGISPAHIGLFENYKKFPTRAQFQKIIEVLKKP